MTTTPQTPPGGQEGVRTPADSEAPVTPVASRSPGSIGSALPSLAWKPVTAIAALLFLALAITAGSPGFQGDELYFLGAGRHLDWSYADNPPLLPFLARLLDAVSGGSLFGLRLPSALLAAAGTFVAALTARELGGGTKAQWRTAAAWAVIPLTLIAGHALSATTIDVFAWAAVSWLLVRWIRTRADRLLLIAALVSAVAMQAKYSIVFLWLAIVLSVLVAGPRDLLRRPALWLGALGVAVTLVPGLLWQAGHGWPQLQMAGVFAIESTGPVSFVLLSLFLAGAPLVVLLGYGIGQLLRAEALRPYRFFAWSFLGLFVLFLLTGGRPTYVAGLFPVLWAAGAVRMEQGSPAAWWRWLVTWPVYAVVAALAVVTSLPVLPPSPDDAPVAGTPNNPQAAETVGWPELAKTVGDVGRSLPAGERDHAAVVTEFYTEAGALEFSGPGQGLPKVYSAHRGYWYFGAPDDSTTVTIFVGSGQAELSQLFTDVREAATVHVPEGHALDGTKVWVCKGLRGTWSQVWPELGHLL